MPEVFTEIVDRRGGMGRTERFVRIEVRVSDDPVAINWNLIDGRGRRDLKEYANNGKYEAVAAVAKIEWKSNEDRVACIADNQLNEKRLRRWNGMIKYLERMNAGDFPQFAHVYLHPSLTGAKSLTVIDGTRRMLAYLELGRKEMPVIVFRAVE